MPDFVTNHSVLAFAGYIVASLSWGLICYMVGSLNAANEADKKIATMRREYVDAMNALYHKFSLAVNSPTPRQQRPMQKPRPNLHVFKNDDKKDEQPHK